MKRMRIVIGTIALLIVCACTPWPTNPGTAIIVGVSDYGISSINLNYCDDDAHAMAALFSSQGYTVYKYVDANATREHLETALRQADAAKPIIIYYSGHGIDPLRIPQGITPGYYMLPYGAITLSGSNLVYHRESMLSIDDIQTIVRERAMKHCIVIADACYSGGYITNSSGASAVPDDYDPVLGKNLLTYSQMADSAFNKFLVYSGNSAITVIAASGSQEQSFESGAYENGVFTEYFLKAINDPGSRADRDRDGYITTSEVYLYTANLLNKDWNSTTQSQNNTDQIYLPHISDNAREYILFKLKQ